MNERRARYILVVFGLLFITMIGYLTHMEIFYSDKYIESSTNPRNTYRDVNIIRGTIFDKSGEILAYSEITQIEPTITSDGQSDNEPIRKIVRRYPHNDLYTGVIGYVTSDYSSRTLIEDVYNTELLDTNIMTKISDEFSNKEITGKNIKLTIDHQLQTVAYTAMGSYKGAIVVMNPKTGAIYAMVSKPSQDANNIIIDESEDNSSSLFSRPIQFTYPPGSTYKIITAAAILEEGLEDEIYNDTNGSFIIESSDGNPDNNYECHNADGAIYYETDLNKGFTKSSNVYFAHMSVKLGAEKMRSISERFLLNNDISELFGFELDVKTSHFQKGNMTDAEVAMSSIGQGQTEMTPLHLALVGSTIANNGVMPKPYLVSSIGGENVTPHVQGKQIISPKIAKAIKDMMLNVTQSGTGTMASLSHMNIDVCGKTGTSENGEKGKTKDHALYVGFAPYDDPEILVCVILENVGGYGGTYAAPISKKIMEQYFNN